MAENAPPTEMQGTEAQPQPQDVDWKERHDRLAAQYQQDMEKVYTMITQQQAAPPQPQLQPPPAPDWDVTDPKQLKQNVEQSLQTTVTNVVAPVMYAFAQNQYETQMMHAKRDERMPYFAHWENEIRELAKGVQPGLLAQYNTLVNLYQLVASRHGQELVELEVRRRLAQQQAAQQADEVEVEDEDSPERSAQGSPPSSPQQPPSHPSPPRQPPPAQPVQSMQPARSTRTSGVRRLTREEAYMAQQMGMSLKDYAAAKDLGDYDL